MPRHRRSTALAVAVVTTALTIALAGCGRGDATPTTAEATVQLFRFRPHVLTVDAGTTVSWRNEDQILHTVTGDGFDGHLDGAGTTFRHRFDRAGTYEYRCTRHPGMDAEVVVR